ncbi:MAG: hypothetical protein PHP35_02965 [Candidatus Colwellbacteria bacterium]|nr:hypothetical protein [Candidatus Colwellbacteria bacterium]
MKDEAKEKWLRRLKKINNQWEDGDVGNKDRKTADLVNKKLKLVIEIKSDKTTNLSGRVISLNKKELFSRYFGYASDASKKFINYPSYKTILLVEGQILNKIFKSVTNGILYKSNSAKDIFLENKNFLEEESLSNIGCYVVSSIIRDTVSEYYFYKNNIAEFEGALDKKYVESILNVKFNN